MVTIIKFREKDLEKIRSVIEKNIGESKFFLAFVSTDEAPEEEMVDIILKSMMTSSLDFLVTN